MEFAEALEVIKSVLQSIGSDISQYEYDGLIVKKLEVENTLDEEQLTNQTPITITGKQMDMFPYVRADGYFEAEYDKTDAALKNYFIAQIPVYIHKENVNYSDNTESASIEDEQLVHVSIVRSRRNNEADQIRISMTNIDSPAYVSYRKLVHAKVYLLLLKRRQKLLYDLYSIKESDGDSAFKDLNNAFYKLATNTPVKLDEILLTDKEKKNREKLLFNNSSNCARKIVDMIYKIDSFGRIKHLIKNNTTTFGIYPKIKGGKYLSGIFVKPNSPFYDKESGGKMRVFTDREYRISLAGVSENCRLSSEWVSTNLGKKKNGNNQFLQALVNVVNEEYGDFIKIYEEENGNWYLEYIEKVFTLEQLPDVFTTDSSKRFITSLLAKPFVILTGNSGTGKTRIAKQFATYLETYSEGDKKNWVLVPVGADWTDNTKILGFYNPLADEGKGRYEETEILQLIERANRNKNKPYFIILDEMNLSHVERYFTDFLSHMETMNIPFILDGHDTVEYPSNIFVIGTVNIDETTYMFSPKVLDRANVIEFKPEEKSVLDLFINPAPTKEIAPVNNGTAEAFLRLAKKIRTDTCGLDESSLSEIRVFFEKVYEITKKYGYEFAFRSVKEIRRYIAAAYELWDNKDSFDFGAAEDEQLLQKILPKIHGNKKEIGSLLDELSVFCEQNKMILSGDKIEQMKGKLAAVQYANFI